MKKNLPVKAKLKPEDVDAMLKDKMGAIQALIDAIAAEQQDCDIMLAEILENENEQVRIAIVEKLRELLKAKAEEKEKELDKYLEAQRRVEVQRQRNIFTQWLAWIMSEETLRKIREAFIARPGMERAVKNIGQDLANFGLQTDIANRRDLGGLAQNVAAAKGHSKGKGDKGRE